MTSPPSSQQEVTRLLADWSGGDAGALERLIPLVQPELHRLAHHYMSREAIGHTLQTTALLNEAYLHLVDDPKRNWQNRTHFVAAAAQLMRRIMVDHARERRALKRGGGAVKVELDDAALVTERRSEELFFNASDNLLIIYLLKPLNLLLHGFRCGYCPRYLLRI